jgi:hypothetical protein
MSYRMMILLQAFSTFGQVLEVRNLICLREIG